MVVGGDGGVGGDDDDDGEVRFIQASSLSDRRDLTDPPDHFVARVFSFIHAKPQKRRNPAIREFSVFFQFI